MDNRPYKGKTVEVEITAKYVYTYPANWKDATIEQHAKDRAMREVRSDMEEGFTVFDLTATVTYQESARPLPAILQGRVQK